MFELRYRLESTGKTILQYRTVISVHELRAENPILTEWRDVPLHSEADVGASLPPTLTC